MNINSNRDIIIRKSPTAAQQQSSSQDILFTASERDPLLSSSKQQQRQQQQQTHHSGNLRARRSSKSSSLSLTNNDNHHTHNNNLYNYQSIGGPSAANSMHNNNEIKISLSFDPSFPQIPPPEDGHLHSESDYEMYVENNSSMSVRTLRSQLSQQSKATSAARRSTTYGGESNNGHNNHHNLNSHQRNMMGLGYVGVGESILNEEIYAVRRSALKVMDPLTYVWLVVTLGTTVSSAFGMSRWTGLLPKLPYWFILLPCWISHAGLFICQAKAIIALSTFIADANAKRQLLDSMDHVERSEYLPLLQKSLKYGFKSGTLSIFLFAFEVLLTVFLSTGSLSVAVLLTPLWIIVVGGITEGVICKNQSIIRLFAWVIALIFMILLVLRFDYEMTELRFSILVTPVISLLLMSLGSLIYILYGQNIGYFHLTNVQKVAGRLYTIANLLALSLIGILMEEHLARPNTFQLRVVLVAMTSLIVSLVGLGAWAICCDEFEQLLQYGGQNTIIPMKLKLEQNGWTSVESRDVTNILMFGEVGCEPLPPKKKSSLFFELACMCCACYPYAQEDDVIIYESKEQTDASSVHDPSEIRNSDTSVPAVTVL